MVGTDHAVKRFKPSSNIESTSDAVKQGKTKTTRHFSWIKPKIPILLARLDF